MFPVLFSIGHITVSSFGVFLTLGFLAGVFLVWRLSRAWDLDEEKVLDLILLTFLGGILGARLYFVIEHLSIFAVNFLRIILVNKYPGVSFWGAFLGGWLTLYVFAKRKKEDFWLLADIASVGLLGGLIFANLGCFLGGCNVGIHRFPTQLLEAILMLLVVRSLWSQAVHFHLRGKILSLSLIYLGIIKFLMEGQFLSLVTFFLGVIIFYKVTKRNIISDIKNIFRRRVTMDEVKKYWYNQTTSISWKLRNLKKSLRRLNVKFPEQNT